MKLHDAAFQGDVEQCKNRLKKRWWRRAADVNEHDYSDGSGQTPLITATIQGHTAVVEFLLANGAYANLRDNAYLTALHYAVDDGQIEIVKLLLQKGADANALSPKEFTILHNAAAKGYTPIVKLLLEHGADVNATDEDKRTPLHYAAMTGHKDAVEILLDNGAKVPKRSKSTSSIQSILDPGPIEFATAAGYTEIAELIKARTQNER